MSKVGVVMASTGGYKTIRALESWRRVERLPVHVTVDISSNSWRQGGFQSLDRIRELAPVRLVENKSHINGTLNRGIEWMQSLGYSHACLLHDDILFGPVASNPISSWFTPQLLAKSGITFGHLEAFKKNGDEKYARRHPSEWDQIDLSSPKLWSELMSFRRDNDTEIHPVGEDWFVKYEGPDKLRKWNRLGPTACVLPISTWESVGKFDERAGIFYDQEYPSECFRRGLPPIYAVPNVPHLHLHNQSMNPWLDPAPGPWSNSMAAYEKRFGARDNRCTPWAGFWLDTWEEEWKD